MHFFSKALNKRKVKLPVAIFNIQQPWYLSNHRAAVIDELGKHHGHVVVDGGWVVRSLGGVSHKRAQGKDSSTSHLQRHNNALYFVRKKQAKCHWFAISFPNCQMGAWPLNSCVFLPDWLKKRSLINVINETIMWGNPALIVSKSVTTKWAALTWTVSIVECLIQTGDVFLEVSTWQSEQKPSRKWSLLYCEISSAKKWKIGTWWQELPTHFIKLAFCHREAHSCSFQANCFAQIRKEEHT